MSDMRKRFKTEQEFEACFIRAEEAQFRLAAILQSLDNVIISKKLDGLITSWNPGAEKIYGYREEEMLGKSINILVPPERQSELKLNFERVSRGESINAFETERVRKDGSRIAVSLTISPIVERDGSIHEAISIAQDITDRKQSEKALAESNERIRAIAESSMDAIVMIDEEDIITYYNARAEQMFGYAAEEMLGRELHHFIGTGSTRDDYCRALPRFKETGLCQVMGRPIERHATRKDGSRISVEIYIVTMDINGKRHTVGTMRDMTERKQLEEERLRTQKLASVGILAGGIAHDFNNLLQVIRGNITFAKKFVDSNDKIYNLLRASDESCVRAIELSYRLLTFAKGGEPIKKVISIPDVLRGSVLLARSGSAIEVEFVFQDGVSPVEVDEGQFNQVVQNLVFNAKEAMPAGGLLKVYATNVVIHDGDREKFGLQGGNYVKISFEDRGTGITAEDLPKIFDPYFSTKEMGAQKGRGLGLSVCYSIINKHGGLITVESRPGSGSTFHVYLPALERRTGERTMRETPEVLGNVLVMDDEEGVRRLAGMMLKDLGYDVGFARNGDEVIQLYKEASASGNPFDAVIIDLTIPGGEGGEKIIHRLAELDPGVTGIVSSGYADDAIMRDCRKHGFAASLPKPYDIDQLEETLRTILKERR